MWGGWWDVVAIARTGLRQVALGCDWRVCSARCAANEPEAVDLCSRTDRYICFVYSVFLTDILAVLLTCSGATPVCLARGPYARAPSTDDCVCAVQPQTGSRWSNRMSRTKRCTARRDYIIAEIQSTLLLHTQR